MKNIKNSFFVFALLFLGVSCEKDFDELNTNTVDPTSVDQVFLLNNAIIGTSYPNGTLYYDMGIVQQIVSPNSGVLTGANYNQDNRDGTREMWNDYYEGVIKNTSDVIFQLSEVPEKSNLYNMARIIQAYAFMVLTDEYGDIPYSEAGKGISDQVVLPKYDAQEDIYPDLIAEITEAVSALSVSGNTESGEVLYGGDIAKWKKMGYSLLLRIGMRLTKVDPAMAQQVVAAAFAGGVMQSNEDNFVVRHDSNFTNALGSILNGTEANNYYLVSSFVDYLMNTDDPRLGAIAVRYIGATSGPEQKSDIASTDPSVQVGMPMGYDNGSIGAVATDLGLASFYDFSQADRTRVAKIDAPMFLITFGQTQLLLAEAALRGWVSGDPATYYEAGVRAHMEQMGLYSNDSNIPSGDIDAYLTAHPYDGGNAMEQINTQYWVASFMNGPEGFANFRRSGYPSLMPNPYPGQDITGDFIHRLTYPNSEIAVNGDNLAAAEARMGPDNLDTHVWWDK